MAFGKEKLIMKTFELYNCPIENNYCAYWSIKGEKPKRKEVGDKIFTMVYKFDRFYIRIEQVDEVKRFTDKRHIIGEFEIPNKSDSRYISITVNRIVKMLNA